MLRQIAIIACLCLVSCSVEQPPLLAENIVLTRPVPGSSMGAGYMTLRNTSSQAIRISRIASTDFVSIAMHESIVEDGVARMRELSELELPPRQSLVLEPGGKHLMMRHSAATPDTVTLQFYADNAMLLSLQVPLANQAD
jgi:periplasmic copper chaperone A